MTAGHATDTAIEPTAAAPRLMGLSSEEARARLKQGQGNTTPPSTGRTYWDIIRDNLLNFFNVTLVGIGLVLVAMGQVRDAIMSSGLAVINGAMGVAQEVIAKRRLDKIALLNRTNATVIRDGQPRSIPPEEIVLGDLLVLAPGDQIFVDGALIDGAVQVDESLLTGESDPVTKHPGDPLSSGSFCVSGSGVFEAQKVGDQSMAAQIAARAKARRVALTPLQQDVNRVVRILLVVAGFFLAAILLGAVLHGYPVRETVLSSAVVLGIVPSGLFLMIVVTYSMAILRLARQNALIQQINAVESLSNVDVFCMDKTGTLTANKLQLVALQPMTGDEATIRATLGDYARSAPGGNKTTDAIADACPGAERTLTGAVPFSSARKWSAVAADTDGFRGVFALGAPEFLGRLTSDPDGLQAPAGWADNGWRILLWATAPDPGAMRAAEGDAEPTMPTLTPVAWLAFADELRPNARETLDGFRDAGIALKIISGDNPETVAALARQAGLPDNALLVSGLELDEMDDSAFSGAAENATIFGRVTPGQKERLVNALKAQGHYVAMTGDGVNDVLSLKQANLGIAMQSGSQATRNAADIVLLKDSFSALPTAFLEGQRIRRGLQSILYLFLTRVFTVALVILAALLVEAGFPFSPALLSLLTLLTVGVPTFGMALWAQPGAPTGSLGQSLIRFVLPAATFLAVAAFAVYIIVWVFNRIDLPTIDGGVLASVYLTRQDETAREAMLHVLVLGGLILVGFAAPPSYWWAVVETRTNDWRPLILAGLMLPVYVAVLLVDPLRKVFGLSLLGPDDYFVIAGIVILWAFALRRSWQRNWFGRFFGYDG